MKYNLITTAPADFSAVTLAEAKLHLRIDHSDEDALIQNLITAATELCENHADLQFCDRNYQLYLDDFPSGREPIYLPRGNFIGLTAPVTYVDVAGVAQVIPLLNLIEFGVTSNSGGIVPEFGALWPSVIDEVPFPVSVFYHCGWQSVGDVPQLVKQAILLQVGALYEYRENLVSGAASKLAVGVEDLLAPFKIGDEFRQY